MGRVDAGQVQLTQRDIGGLSWVGEQWGIRLDHLQYVLALASENSADPVSVGAAREVVARWRRAGWAESRKILAGHPAWVWLTRAGLETVGLPYQEWEPKATGLAHLHAVTAARLWLLAEDRKAGRRGQWVSERHLRYVDHQQGVTQATRDQLPDGEMHYSGGVVAIEVELTQKAAQRTVDIMAQRLESYRGLFYFVTAETKDVVTKAHATLGTPKEIRILDTWTHA